MDPKRFTNVARGAGKGAGLGVGLLAAVGGIAYGMSQALYTGEF